MKFRDEGGMTLVELLIASVLSLVVMGASLAAFDGAWDEHGRTQRHNEAQDEARVTVDRLARELRNLSSPTDFSTPAGTIPNSMEKNGPFDVMFKTVDNENGAVTGNLAGVKRVRYCLDAATPSAGVLWLQEQTSRTFTTLAPSTSACPAPGWTRARRVVGAVVNRAGDRQRPLFTYSANGVVLPYGDLSKLQETIRIGFEVFVDPDPQTRPTETRLSSSVVLRNQNRRPVASFTARWVNQSACIVKLNGSASEDPEAEPLRFFWSDNGAAPQEGIELQLQLTAGEHVVALSVQDPAGLEGVITRTLYCGPAGGTGGDDDDDDD